MSRFPLRRLLVIGALIFLAVGIIGLQFAVRTLKSRIEEVLGPQGEVHKIHVGLVGLEIQNLRLRAREGSGWPVEDELRAKRIVITPDVFDLLLARLSVSTIRVEGAYVSMLRTKGGQMKILPSLLGESATKPGGMSSTGPDAKGETDGGLPPIRVGKIELADGMVEFTDASLRANPVKFRIESISATLGRVQLPALNGYTSLNIEGTLKGNHHDGKISIDGSIELASRNSGITTRLRGVELTMLQPYLLRSTEPSPQRGTVDLDLKSSVSDGKLRAPGTLVLSELELSAAAGNFMGLPRDVMIGLMNDKKGKIPVRFLLEGDIDNPHFSLNEQMPARLGSALAGSLGVNLESLTKGGGSMIGSLAGGVGESAVKRARKKR